MAAVSYCIHCEKYVISLQIGAGKFCNRTGNLFQVVGNLNPLSVYFISERPASPVKPAMMTTTKSKGVLACQSDIYYERSPQLINVLCLRFILEVVS
jgi:hypothetical protein